MKKKSLRKASLYLGPLLLISFIFLYGVYQYTIDKCSQEIDELLETLIAEEDLQKIIQEHKNDFFSEERVSQERTKNKDTEPDAVPPLNEISSSKEDALDLPPKTLPINSSTESKNEEPEKNEPVPEELPKEESALSNQSIFKSMTLKEQVYVINLMNRFSIGEIMEMFGLYKKGGSAWKELKGRLMERLTEEEITKVKELYEKY
ncbi:MAG: hypothetical protein Q7I94_05685 [Candidatus Contubernalis sp.]|nr:hypothetical protein [Candidatus Contubernalis sp.]